MKSKRKNHQENQKADNHSGSLSKAALEAVQQALDSVTTDTEIATGLADTSEYASRRLYPTQDLEIVRGDEGKATIGFESREADELSLLDELLLSKWSHSADENNSDNLKKQIKISTLFAARELSSFILKNTINLLNQIDKCNNIDELDEELSNTFKSHSKDQLQQLILRNWIRFFDSPSEAEDFFRALASEIRSGLADEMPSSAPTLYGDRENRKEKPEDFLRRVYGDWLNGRGLYRSHIKAWDLSLYQALYRRRDIIKDFDKLLPKAQGRTPEDIARTDAELLESRRASNRRSMAKAYP